MRKKIIYFSRMLGRNNQCTVHFRCQRTSKDANVGLHLLLCSIAFMTLTRESVKIK